MTTLVYIAAGWDDSFLQLKYTHYILIDQMPGYPYFEHPCQGYFLQKNFFQTLQDVFGDFERGHNPRVSLRSTAPEGRVLVWNRPTCIIEYHYSTKIEKLEDIPPGDIYLNGWEPNFDLNLTRRVFSSCESIFDREYEMICTCGEC